jgi:hypothetical protein
MSRYANQPVWNPKIPEVPVDKDGNWLNFPSTWNGGGWEKVLQPFYAVMEIDGMRTGRSSKIVILKDVETGKTYPMFVSDLVDGIAKGNFEIRPATPTEGGRIVAYWTGSKRGANYGIKAVPKP